MTRPLDSKIAIVTGASRGIGRAIAERLGRDGARVVLTYVANDAAAREVVTTIEASGGAAHALRADMKNLAEVRGIFDAAESQFGKVDILVNNAAGVNVFKPTEAMTADDYDSMFLITRGVYFSLQEAAKRLANNGRIVNISTAGTAMAMAGAGAYAGSKAAIEHFSMALAKELGPRGITVNTVRPGVTNTDGLVLDAGSIQHLISQTPMGRLGKPTDIAAAVALLVGADAGWITGQNVAATGGIV
jgi:3-oxoacyl-[acyl-carrier protein] reductase